MISTSLKSLLNFFNYFLEAFLLACSSGDLAEIVPQDLKSTLCNQPKKEMKM